jgi:hypothetical protein
MRRDGVLKGRAAAHHFFDHSVRREKRRADGRTIAIASAARVAGSYGSDCH